jgi:predicted RNA-binding protein with TRAM domain
MEISDQLRCLFTAAVERRDGSHVVEVPDQEIQLGGLEDGETYRVALLAAPDEPTDDEESTSDEPNRERGPPAPPVEMGETRRVEIEEIGDQGDGIAKVERGYVVVVPDTERGERVEIEITDVKQNVAFARVTDRISYYD